MAFRSPMRPYTKADVVTIVEGQIGCYGIFSGRSCLYVGKGDIRTRMLAHLNGDNPCISFGGPDLWTASVVNTEEDADELEKQLTYEYKPFCNQRVG